MMLKRKFVVVVFTLILAFVTVCGMPLSAYAATQQQAVSWLNSLHSHSCTKGGTACVALYNEYLESFWGIGWNTVGSFSAAKQIATGNYYPSGWVKITDGIPQPGDVAVYNSTSDNPYGHVSIVVAVNSPTDYYTIDQGYTGTCYLCGRSNAREVHMRRRTTSAMAYIRPNFDLVNSTPTISLTTEPSNNGPKITATTDGTEMYYQLRSGDQVIAEEAIYSNYNLWDFSKWGLGAGTYTFEVQASRNGVLSKPIAHSFTISKPFINLSALPSSNGPQITVTTDGTEMYYQLRLGDQIVAEEAVYSNYNLWDFSKWGLAKGIYTFEAQASRNGMLSDATAI